MIWVAGHLLVNQAGIHNDFCKDQKVKEANPRGIKQSHSA